MDIVLVRILTGIGSLRHLFQDSDRSIKQLVLRQK
jgi:hypothetical protein